MQKVATDRDERVDTQSEEDGALGAQLPGKPPKRERRTARAR